jgi:hypothetical protein
MSDPVYARVNGELRTFHGPGLLRKPRVGERLVSRTTGASMVVERFDSLHPNIVHVRYESGVQSFFVWRFSDCLNRLVRHEDAS